MTENINLKEVIDQVWWEGYNEGIEICIANIQNIRLMNGSLDHKNIIETLMKIYHR